MTVFRNPQGYYTSAESFMEDFKRINNVEWMEEQIFIEQHTIVNGIVYLHTDRPQPKIVKKSRFRNAFRFILTYFVRITDSIIENRKNT